MNILKEITFHVYAAWLLLHAEKTMRGNMNKASSDVTHTSKNNKHFHEQ